MPRDEDRVEGLKPYLPTARDLSFSNAWLAAMPGSSPTSEETNRSPHTRVGPANAGPEPSISPGHKLPDGFFAINRESCDQTSPWSSFANLCSDRPISNFFSKHFRPARRARDRAWTADAAQFRPRFNASRADYHPTRVRAVVGLLGWRRVTRHSRDPLIRSSDLISNTTPRVSARARLPQLPPITSRARREEPKTGLIFC